MEDTKDFNGNPLREITRIVGVIVRGPERRGVGGGNLAAVVRGLGVEEVTRGGGCGRNERHLAMLKRSVADVAELDAGDRTRFAPEQGQEIESAPDFRQEPRGENREDRDDGQ